MTYGYRSAGSTHTFTRVSDVDANYIDERNKKFRFTTDGSGNLTSFKTPIGNETAYEYDRNGQLFREIGEDPDGPTEPGIAPVYLYGYDSVGNLIQVINADGTSSSSTYDPVFNQMTSSTNELGIIETWTHDVLGNVNSYTDAEGNLWTYTYDGFGNLLTETTPEVADGVSSSVAEANGTNPVGETGNDDTDHFEDNPVSIVTTYVYENTIYNRLAQIVFDDGSTQHFSWTDADQLESFTDEIGLTTHHSYDPLDRLVSTTLPDPDGPLEPKTSPVYLFEYGDDLLLESETDPLGNTITV